jgi:hypothetical protein
MSYISIERVDTVSILHQNPLNKFVDLLYAASQLKEAWFSVEVLEVL